MPQKNKFSLLFKFSSFLKLYRKEWFKVIFYGLIAMCSGLASPYLGKLIIDNGIARMDLRAFFMTAGIAALLFLANECSTAAREFYLRYIRLKLSFSLGKALFKKIQGLPFNWFQEHAVGEHIYRLDHDIDGASAFLASIIPQSFLLLPRLVIILAIVLYLSWQMAAFSILLTLFLYLPVYYFSRRIQKSAETFALNSEALFTSMAEIFSRIQLIKVFGKEKVTVARYLKKLFSGARLMIENIRLELFCELGESAAGKLIVGLIGCYGGYQVIKGKMSFGSMSAVLIYLYQMVELQGEFQNFLQSRGAGIISLRRVSDILEQKSAEQEKENALAVNFDSGSVVFKGISFGYIPGRPILDNISFTINSGAHICLAGASGCGKTTLLNLILRLYDPWQGEVMVGGYNISDIKLSSLKSQIGFALQEPFLWNDSIENNIRYGKEDASVDELSLAIRVSLVDEFAQGLESGMNTVIGENASKISEGQKQKVAIARALVRNPKVLIFDEAMSSMDYESSERIAGNIKKDYPGVTFIMVSHRLSNVLSADLVYYFSKPDKIIIDSPQKLLKENLDFARLFTGHETPSV